MADPGSTTTDRPLSKSQALRRRRIIDAALTLVRQQGHAQTQMREIADVSELALGTVYRYFPSKEVLLASVFEVWCEGYWETLGIAAEGQANVDRLIDLARRSLQAYVDERNILTMINSDRKSTRLNSSHGIGSRMPSSA